MKTPDLGDALILARAVKRMYCCETPDRFLIVIEQLVDFKLRLVCLNRYHKRWAQIPAQTLIKLEVGLGTVSSNRTVGCNICSTDTLTLNLAGHAFLILVATTRNQKGMSCSGGEILGAAWGYWIIIRLEAPQSHCHFPKFNEGNN